jgi:uncharacterized protein YndB with AHSA1/START domain
MNRLTVAALALAGFLAPSAARAEPPAPLRKEVVVAAPAAEVWTAWTTSAGAKTFFAPGARIELARGGAYDILFAPDAPPGQRGAEGLHVLSFVPGAMISFEWSAPPTFPDIRKQGASSFVVVEIARLGPRKTKVVLHHLGWGSGGRWPEVRAYFDKAWDVVLGRLQTRFAGGRPIDWANPPGAQSTDGRSGS